LLKLKRYHRPADGWSGNSGKRSSARAQGAPERPAAAVLRLQAVCRPGCRPDCLPPLGDGHTAGRVHSGGRNRDGTAEGVEAAAATAKPNTTAVLVDNGTAVEDSELLALGAELEDRFAA
jgi:hypothetical protein